MASSPSGAAVAPSYTPVRARYNNRCTASAFSLGSDSRRASTKATCSCPMAMQQWRMHRKTQHRSTKM